MLTKIEQERAVGDILRTSFEVVTLEDFGVRVLPHLERALDTSASILYRCDEQGRLVPIAGTLVDTCEEYGERYYSEDPLHPVERSLNPWIFHASHHPIWEKYLKSAAYNDFLHPRDTDYLMHLRLLDTGYHEPGMIGLLLSRSIRQPDFGKEEEGVLAHVFPVLQALVRRFAVVEDKLRMYPTLEAILDLGSTCKIALTLRGSFLWASKRAHDLLSLGRGNEKVPEALVEAACRLGALFSGMPTSVVPVSLPIPRKDHAPIEAELRIARTDTGDRFVLVEFDDPGISPRLAESAALFKLTRAETDVLSLLSLGLADREIGRRLFISLPTVRTHVGRILTKLGVNSRVQAALVAHGIRPSCSPSPLE